MKIAVTGGSGGGGHAVILDLIANNYACVNLDIRAPKETLCPFVEVDLTDYRAVFKALEGIDAVVHFGGNPNPDNDHFGAADRFENNTLALFNVFNAAQARGIKRVVWASSETIFGFPFETSAPQSIPLTEASIKQPQNGYALSKVISEDLAEQMAALYGMTIVGLRLSNVLYDDETAEASFQKIPGYWADTGSRRFNLWSYIDSRDAARVVRLSLEADLDGAEVFTVAAPDTLMSQPSRELLATHFPTAEIAPEFGGHDSPLSSEKAKRLLGFEAEHTWQRVLGVTRD
ncbi:UDP-glucose 4-epimerase [Tritonibacter multivorans]|uniref:UDP-glucose 4-epimerase n=1 Tax=Tritonibacter multivorans TaxID=928856 RepID=A0A0P1GBL2_9RHOB|nr:NAD(P)-dependent oxidoreductase [Tritonibacter multivorans]MDA7421991.1 NAD(P)-dependent oxidoreductase [Tritonibacter multivorans]CUH78712.1 UDP-glucose 4-epimerase [Tritonibacter multivorans]SFD67889.1 Nucleoside-diphosphate-sugar epimerase [Tritonibacter multivorans]